MEYNFYVFSTTYSRLLIISRDYFHLIYLFKESLSDTAEY